MKEVDGAVTPVVAAGLDEAEALLSGWTVAAARPEPARLDLSIDVDHLLAAVQALSDQRWGALSAVTGLDHGADADRMEVLYHFCDGAAILTLRVDVQREAAVVPSLCGILPAARLYEQELTELMGVTVAGLPDMGRLFLADDWPADVHPLRKDAPLPEGNEP